MSLDSIFPVKNVSDTEEALVLEAFSNPIIKQFLTRLAIEDTKELLRLSAINTDKEKLAQAHAVVQGKLQVISTLLEIAFPN